MASSIANRAIWTVAILGAAFFLFIKLFPELKAALASSGGGGGPVGAGSGGGYGGNSGNQQQPQPPQSKAPTGGSSSPNSQASSLGAIARLNSIILEGWRNATTLSTTSDTHLDELGITADTTTNPNGLPGGPELFQFGTSYVDSDGSYQASVDPTAGPLGSFFSGISDAISSLFIPDQPVSNLQNLPAWDPDDPSGAAEDPNAVSADGSGYDSESDPDGYDEIDVGSSGDDSGGDAYGGGDDGTGGDGYGGGDDGGGDPGEGDDGNGGDGGS